VKIVIAYLGQFQTVGSSACSVVTLSACREFRKVYLGAVVYASWGYRILLQTVHNGLGLSV